MSTLSRNKLVFAIYKNEELEESFVKAINEAFAENGRNDHTLLRLFSMTCYNTHLLKEALDDYDKEHPTMKTRLKKLFRQ